MREKPILFKGEMVRAVLSGAKTMTRRVMRYQPTPVPQEYIDEGWNKKGDYHVALPCAGTMCDLDDAACMSPYGYKGDQLWVRETFAEKSGLVAYRADGQCGAWMGDGDGGRWKPSIHMPRKYSRIQLEVTDVRVERVQDISEEDAIAEGVVSDHAYADDPDAKLCACPQCDGTGVCGAAYAPDYGVTEIDCTKCDTPRKRFQILWDSINNNPPKRPYGWDANPWVWVVSFKKI